MEIVQFIAKGILFGLGCGLFVAGAVAKMYGGSKALKDSRVARNVLEVQIWTSAAVCLGYLAWAQP